MPFASASVTTSSSVIIPANSARSVYVVANPPNSGQTVYLQEGATATATAACLALVAGDSYTGRGGAAIHAIGSDTVAVTVNEY